MPASLHSKQLDQYPQSNSHRKPQPVVPGTHNTVTSSIECMASGLLCFCLAPASRRQLRAVSVLATRPSPEDGWRVPDTALLCPQCELFCLQHMLSSVPWPKACFGSMQLHAHDAAVQSSATAVANTMSFYCVQPEPVYATFTDHHIAASCLTASGCAFMSSLSSFSVALMAFSACSCCCVNFFTSSCEPLISSFRSPVICCMGAMKYLFDGQQHSSSSTEQLHDRLSPHENAACFTGNTTVVHQLLGYVQV